MDKQTRFSHIKRSYNLKNKEYMTSTFTLQTISTLTPATSNFLTSSCE